MSADPRPSSDAILASLVDAAAAEAVIADLTAETSVDASAIAHGTGESFALCLEGSEDATSVPERLGKWLLSLGQERQELMELGQAAREGEHAMVINDVEDDTTKDAVIAVIKRHGGSRITHVGDWQSEDVL